jgi:DNA repair protein RAD16
VLDSEDDDDDEFEDNSRDAQLARALQNEENERSELVSTVPQTSLGTSRRGRARRSVLPMTDFADDFSEGEDAYNPPSKKAKLSDRKGKARATVPDSDEESEFTDVFSSADENDFPNFLNLTEDEETRPPRRPVQARRRYGQNATQRRGICRPSPIRVMEPADDAVPIEQPDAADEEASDDDSEMPDFSTMTPAERRAYKLESRARAARQRLETHHPELLVMWKELRDLPKIPPTKAEQPTNISRELKPFQLEGLNWMKMMEKTKWGGGLLGDEMGMGKTIQAVSLIMSDYPAKNPSLVLIPPVALMQWQQEIAQYTDGTLKTFVYHGTNSAAKGVTVATLRKYDVILMSYNSLESLYRFQEKGRKRKDEVAFQKSPVHQIQFHRVILDEAHNIKVRSQHDLFFLQELTYIFLATYYRQCQSLLCT